MATALGRIGVAGAVVLLVGLVVVGSGLTISALAEQSATSCIYSSNPNSCEQNDQNEANTTVLADFLVAGGIIVSGVGLFLVLFAMVAIMARRDGMPYVLPAPPPPSAPEPPPMPPSTPPAASGPPSSWAPPPTWDSPPPRSP
ncbi:MAG: hypothetical protein WB947_07760 [Thermoplasmata archaeon]